MMESVVLHNRDEVKAIMECPEKIRTPVIKVEIPEFTPKEIVNLVLSCNGRADVWIKTSTLSSVSKQKWLVFKRKHENYYLKRKLDILLGITMIFFSLPIFLLTAILVKLSSREGIIFQQQRVNNKLKLFNLYKFRTMKNESDEMHQKYMRENIKNLNPSQKVYKLINDPRITKIGKWIRRLSIDELPQLINVVKGEMSLIGPRPPIPYEVQEYEQWHYARFKAKPGLTGLWQVKGRSLIPFDEMVVLDLYYAYNQSLWFDIKLLLQTIPMVLSLKGAF